MPKKYLALILAVAAAFPVAATAGPQPAKVTVSTCTTDDSAGRSATFQGQMRRVLRARQLAMRFALLERYGGSSFVPVKAPGLGVWHKSAVGAPAFSYLQNVMALRPGAAYRARVEYRWLDGKGRVFERSRRLSAVCRQPGGLPNLQISAVDVAAGQGNGQVDYVVEVLNAGGSDAASFDVQLSLDGAVQPARSIAGLSVGETKKVRFPGAQCSTELRAVVDPQDTVREAVEDDNLKLGMCRVPLTP